MISFNELFNVSCQLNYNHIEAWLKVVLLDHKKELDFINFVFCSDDYLLKINQDFLDHNYFTDVITFDYSDDVICSDIYVSVERVVDNAKNLGVDYQNELLRVMLHGVLHLCGFKDKSSKEELLMRSTEDHYLKLFVSRET
jgi:probable rRNA maturation factor